MSFAIIRYKKSITYGFIVLLCCATFVIYTLGVSAASVSGNFEHVSVNNTGDGQGANATVNNPIISENGRFVAFESTASNLVSNDSNNKKDVFVRDTKSNITQRISISTNGIESNADSSLIDISENGRYVVYGSAATTLEAGPNITHGKSYVYDLRTQTNKHLNVPWWNHTLHTISNDGRFIVGSAYTALHDANGAQINSPRVIMYDARSNIWTRVATPIGAETHAGQSKPSMSCDGALIAFQSSETNLLPQPVSNGTNIYLVDKRNGNELTNLTSTFNGNSSEPKISCNGNYILFNSKATNIDGNPPYHIDGHYYIYNRINNSFSLVDLQSNGDVMYDTFVRGLTDDGEVIFGANTRQTQPKTPYYYLRDTESQITENVTDSNNQHLRADSFGPVFINALDSRGKKFVMRTDRTDIVPNDSNGFNELFISDFN